MSLRRQRPWMLRNISATLLFYGGIATLPAFLFQSDIIIRAAQVVLFGVLAVFAGKRLQWAYFLSVLATVTLFHLLVPSGAVLADPLGVPITAGALRTGLYKGLTIVGMVFLSLASVRADLRIPGQVGAILGKTFWSFEQIMERRSTIEIRSIGSGVDRLLMGLSNDLTQLDADAQVEDTQSRKGTARRSSPVGALVVGTIVALQWTLLFL